MNDNVNHPSHYTNGPEHPECGCPIEAIDITETHTFNAGNAIKYLWRHKLKGTPVEDLRKAAWYAVREADRLESLDTAPDMDVEDDETSKDPDNPRPSLADSVRKAMGLPPLDKDPDVHVNALKLLPKIEDSAVTEVPTLPDTHQPRTSTVRAVSGDRFIGTLTCSCGYFVAGVHGATRSRLVLDLSSVYTEHLRDVWGA